MKEDMTRDDQGLLGSFHGIGDHDLWINQEGLMMNGHDFVEDEIESKHAAEERRIYWESQQFLLQEILDSYNSSGSKLREEIKRNIYIAENSNNICNCLDKNLRCCIKCLRRTSVNQLGDKGFSAFLRTSKWKRTHKIPGGTHEYIEVIASTEGKKKQIPFLVEIGFLDEFRMGKACDEYNRLVDQLPEIYIGKTEHLNAIIRVVCDAARKSTEEQKMHMGPWRKKNFMQMKWSASKERKVLDPLTTVGSSFQLPVATTVKVV